MEKNLAPFDRFMDKQFVPDSIPDSVLVKLHEFALKYPDNAKSEKYLYLATLITESRGNFFETAKWCEDYVKQYPKGKNVLKAMIAAATNYEKTGSTEKAIEFYTMAATKFPDSDIAKQGVKQAEMLRMGIVTPEEQLIYILKHKDSANKKP